MATTGFGMSMEIFWYYISWWLIPIIFIFVYKKILGKYPIEVTIYEKRGNDVIKTNDVAGRFESPIAEYKLKKSKDTIPIPQYDWVLQCMYKPTNIFEKISNLFSGKIGSITLFKYSSKQYKPINVKFKDGNFKKVYKPIKNNKGEDIYVSVYEPINPQLSLSKLDFEVIDWDDINHMTQELRAIALRRSPLLSFLEKWGGWVAFILGVMIIVFAGYYYKEMMIDAGGKYMAMVQGNAPAANSPVNQTSVNSQIPLIGDLLG